MLHEFVNPAVIEQADEFAQSFRGARPFRHVQIDGFFALEFARRLRDAFPPFDEKLAMNENGIVGHKCVHSKVAELGPDWGELDALVQDEEFRALVSRITGIPYLQYDPHYFGGGTHENRHRAYLDAHIDFNFHPATRQHRRLNLIVYLNEEWQAEWGGSIRLHQDPYLPRDDPSVVSIGPAFNRCVIFETTEHSWHSFPRIELPADKRDLTRKSFALYYYTDTRPAEQLGREHSTVYVEEYLPEDWQPGMTLSAEQLQLARDLLLRRDQHLQRLYGDLERLRAEHNQLKEAVGRQAPTITAPEPEDLGEASAEVRAGLLQARLTLRNADLRRLQQQVEEYRDSNSWRITRPLRALKRALTRNG